MLTETTDGIKWMRVRCQKTRVKEEEEKEDRSFNSIICVVEFFQLQLPLPLE